MDHEVSDEYGQANKTWCLGKMIGLYAYEEECILSALAKFRNGKKQNGRTKREIGKGRPKKD